MSNKSCYFPLKGIDDIIAKKLNLSIADTAGYRSIYEEKTGKTLTADDYSILSSFIADLNKEDRREAIRRSKLVRASREAAIYKHLHKTFSPSILQRRIDVISGMFSSRVTDYTDEHPDYTREAVIREVGFGNIISEVKEIIDSMYRAALDSNNLYKIEEYKKIVDNWDALVYMAQSNIRRYEDVILGQDFDFVVEANESNYNDNDTSVVYNIEESVREHWMTNPDFVSAFGSIGKEVRKAISRIYKTSSNGKVERDDIGLPIFLSPNKVHQSLQELFRGVTTSNQMMEVLQNYAENNKWAQELYKKILNNPVLRTQCFVDLYKNFQPYGTQFTDKEGNPKTSILNKPRGNNLFSKYKASITIGNVNSNSIFGKTGNFLTLNKEAIEGFRNTISRLFSIDSKAWETYNKEVEIWNSGKAGLFSKRPKRPTLPFYDKKIEEQLVTLHSIFNVLGINTDVDLLSNILNNKKDSSILFTNLKELSDYALNIKDYDVEGSTLLNNDMFTEKMSKIFNIISKYNNGLAMDSRIRFQGNTYYSNVSPSYMGDFFGYIQNCTSKNDVESLREFIRNKFLTCDTFEYEGVILNKWIEDLYNGDIQDENSFASNASWFRGLAVDDILFEDLSANKHIKYLMTEYFSLREIKGNPNIVYITEEDFNNLKDNKDKHSIYYIENLDVAYKFNKGKWVKETKSDYAYYPVFILGDANVSKFIKARRYSQNEIVEGLYNTYISERRRQANTRDLEEKWVKEGISPIENLLDNKDKFTMLPFLNKDYAGGKYYNIANAASFSKSAVKNAIREYLNDEAKSFEQGLINKKIIEEGNTAKVSDYFYNTYFATIQQLQMMTIDVAFYKDIKDLQKRYKEIHAPGSKLDISAIDVWGNNQPVSDGIERCVYFNDVKVNAEESNPEFMEAIHHHFKGDKREQKYKKNNSTDGQGYRTITSYRKVLIMAGKWNSAYEEAYQALLTIRNNMAVENRDTPTEEEMEALEDMKVVFQPLKPYLYGFESIKGSNQRTPVQHKYAEVVIIPEFLPKNSKLRELANFMEGNGIDVACATSVVKVGSYGSVDISNNTTENLNKAVVHELRYEDYRIQTNVPEHTYQARLFGTQFRKLILSNLKREDYSDYVDGNMVTVLEDEGLVNLNRYNLTRFYNALVVGNIIEAYNKFKEKAGDKYKLSSSAIYQILNNDREIKDNILAMSVDEFGEFVLPLFEGGIEHDAASMLFSIYKNIVNKQKILGGSAVQASDFGISGKEESSNLKYITNEDNTNILYAECEIPFNFAYTDSNGNQVDLRFSDYCNPDGTFKQGSKEGTTKIEEEFPGILDIIAYRIPTERAYSMMNLKVVRCSHPLAGGTIKVPSQGTTIAGFDFDVDKLYFMRKEFRQKVKKNKVELSNIIKNEIWSYIYDEYKDIEAALIQARIDDGWEEGDENAPALNSYWNATTLPLYYDKNEIFNEAADALGISLSSNDMEWDNYDYNKSPFQQSTTARNNMIIELSRRRLMDVETFNDRYTPGGFDNASDAARLIRELKFSDYTSFTSGMSANLDGIRSNINFSDKSSDPEPNYDPSNPMTIITYNQQNQVAGKLIGIFANQNTHHAFISSLESCKLSIPIAFGSYPTGLSDLLHAPSEVDTSETMAELLAASVDAVKDPVLNFLNLNTLTADSGALLGRLGYSLEDIGLLFNQPAIIRLCEYCFDNNMNDIQEAIRVVASEYGSNDITKVTVNPLDISKNAMAYNIIAANKDLSVDKNMQLQVLKLFISIQSASVELSQFIMNTKFTAANSISSTFGEAYEKQSRVNSFVESLDSKERLLEIKVNKQNSPVLTNNSSNFGNKEYLNTILNNPLAFEQAMLDANTKALEFFTELMPYETEGYKDARSVLTYFTKYGVLDAETINSIHRELPVYILQNDEKSFMNPTASYNKDYTVKEYYISEFPKILASKIKDDPFLKDLNLFKFVGFSVEEGKFYIVPQDTGGLDTTQIDTIRQELSTLDKSSEYDWIVEGLFNYSFFTVGFNFNHNSFINLFPTEFKTDYVVAEDYDGNYITYSEYLRAIKDRLHGMINPLDFAVKYCLNHTDNRTLVYYPKGKILNTIKAIISKSKEERGDDSFIIDKSNLGSRLSSFILRKNGDGTVVFKPFLNIEGVIYQADLKTFNQSIGSMTYTKVEPLGDGVNKLNYEGNNASVNLGRTIDTGKDNSNGITAPEASVNQEINIDKVFEEELDKQLVEIKKARLADGSYTSEKEADENLANVKAMYITASVEDKIEFIKKTAPERVPYLRDAEGNKIC